MKYNRLGDHTVVFKVALMFSEFIKSCKFGYKILLSGQRVVLCSAMQIGHSKIFVILDGDKIQALREWRPIDGSKMNTNQNEC